MSRVDCSGERDGFPFSLEEMEGVTVQMRRVGAALIEEFGGSFASEELVAVVYIAMEKQRVIENSQDPPV